MLFLHVAGLSIGIASTFLIYLYVDNQLSADGTHSKGDRIYRVATTYTTTGVDTRTSQTPTAAGPHLATELSRIDKFVRFRRFDVTVRDDDRLFSESGFAYVDSTVFSIFDFPLIQGNPKTALATPNTIVISESMARKYFGQNWEAAEILDQSLEIFRGATSNEYIITGVMQDIPQQSHIRLDFLASMVSTRDSRRPDWNVSYMTTYVLASPGSSSSQLMKQFPMRIDEVDVHGNLTTLHLESLGQIYLNSDFGNTLGETGNSTIVNIFIGTGFLILLMMVINYVNVTTAKSIQRSKEIGIRKISGAIKVSLISQFLFEAFLVVAFSTVVAVLLIALVVTYFNGITGLDISIGSLLTSTEILALVVFILLLTIISGIYPAMRFSRIQAHEVLKGKYGKGRQEAKLRRSLLLVQMVISTLLVFAAITISDQLNYLQSKDMGYNDENVVGIPTRRVFNSALSKSLVEQVRLLPGVEEVSVAMEPINEIQFKTDFYLPEIDEAGKGFNLAMNQVDENFIPLFDLDMVEGSGFQKLVEDDTSHYFIINQSAMDVMGLTPQDAINKELRMNWGVYGWKTGTIVGVVEDFHFRSLHEQIEPLVLKHSNDLARHVLMVRIAANDQRFVIENIRSKWNSLIDHLVFDYSFLHQSSASKYNYENALGKLIVVFTAIGLVISSLGLISMASFMVSQRIKEVGVRKVFGASVAAILQLFGFSFLRIVAVAGVVAIPIGVLLVNNWLNQFAYHLDITLGHVLVSVGLVTIITLVTISYHTFVASVLKPANALRHTE